MTTDPTPDLCCTHGEAVDQLAAELERANRLLAEVCEIRRAQAEEKAEPNRIDLDEVVAFARGGIVKAPDSGIQIHIDPHHVIGATIHELRRQGRLRP